jgi:asparagine synthase (glutamine-hydrolysing)
MSAIFGLVNLDERPPDSRELDLMAAALAAHGPDGGGTWIGERIGLGQRLMCFTPEDRLERQPLVSAEGLHAVVMDGRVDNRPELVQELGVSSAEAREMPDSAFILRSYRKWGLDCRHHLVGDFVFAVCDLHAGHVLIVRSPVSTRTLYYHSAPGRFVFASAPKGLFALPWIAREIDQQRLADYLVQAPREPGSSFFARVSELHSGCSLVVLREGFRLESHWQPDLRQETRFPRDSDYVDAFNAIFDRVIADHLRSLTPVGVMMSGGLDSSSVAAAAARLLSRQGKRLTTFTEVPRAGFDLDLGKHTYADETPFVRAIARKCANLELNFVRTDGFFLDGVDCYFDAQEGPFRAVWNRLWWEAILQEAAGCSMRVLLTGLPGNLTVTLGGEWLLPQLILRGRWLRAFREANACSRQNGTSAFRALARGVAPLLPLPLWLAGVRLLRRDNPALRVNQLWRVNSAINPEFARVHRVEERARQKGHDFCTRVRRETRANRYATLRAWDSGVQVVRGYEALLGVQTRNPMGDVRIVEFCMSLPEEQHQHRGVSRRLIRRAMVDRLPSEVLTNQLRGLQAADSFESVAAARSRMLDELERIEHCELAVRALDLKRLRDVVRQMPEDGTGTELHPFRYRIFLGSAFMTGGFLRWFESSGMKGRGSDAALG